MLIVRILVVEDERKLAHALQTALKAQHCDVVLAPTGEDRFFRANAESVDLLLLDLMLPGRNGLEIHGGQITVNARQGGGSEFLIHLPLAESSPATRESGR
jgi:CheY-like chemotaxis protein